MIKVLSSPFPILLALEACAVLCYWLRLRGRNLAMIVISMVLAVLIALSLPGVSQLTLESLALPPVRGDFKPDYIVVLSGGMEEGPSPKSDVLKAETMRRVLFGVQCWKDHPSARIVMTGAGLGENPGEPTELMAGAAEWLGVPEAAIIRETGSHDTREHPIRLRALGFAPTARLAIVTSPWHERRAMTEFRRYFVNAVPRPFPVVHYEGLVLWVPTARGLVATSEAAQEWVAIVWYRLRAWSGN